jgi:hypothetical protein
MQTRFILPIKSKDVSEAESQSTSNTTPRIADAYDLAYFAELGWPDELFEGTSAQLSEAGQGPNVGKTFWTYGTDRLWMFWQTEPKQFDAESWERLKRKRKSDKDLYLQSQSIKKHKGFEEVTKTAELVPKIAALESVWDESILIITQLQKENAELKEENGKMLTRIAAVEKRLCQIEYDLETSKEEEKNPYTTKRR